MKLNELVKIMQTWNDGRVFDPDERYLDSRWGLIYPKMTLLDQEALNKYGNREIQYCIPNTDDEDIPTLDIYLKEEVK